MRYALTALAALFAIPALAAEPPLPEGAAARLGTTKYRTAGGSRGLSPGGKRLALRTPDGIDVMDLDTGEVVTRLRDPKLEREPIGRDAPRLSFAFASGGK